MTYLWSFDPGLATGAALGEYTATEPYRLLSTWAIPNGLDGYLDWLESYGPGKWDDVVTERFIIDGTITGVWSPQVEGVLALLGRQEQFKVTGQLRTDKAALIRGNQSRRNAWIDERFPGLNSQHERDAVVHALVFMRRKRPRHLPTLREYFGPVVDYD